MHIKLCPFCGDVADLIFSNGDVFVECGNCCARTGTRINKQIKTSTFSFADILEASKAAVETWNERSIKNDWISVLDEQPIMNKMVIVTDGELVVEAHYNGRAEWVMRNGHVIENVTHWMEMPPAP